MKCLNQNSLKQAKYIVNSCCLADSDCGQVLEQIWLFILSCAVRAYRNTRCTNAMRRNSLYPAAGTAVHLSNPAETLGRMLFNNFFHNYSLPLNKNQFPAYFHFTFSPVTLIKGAFGAFKHITLFERESRNWTKTREPKKKVINLTASN